MARLTRNQLRYALQAIATVFVALVTLEATSLTQYYFARKSIYQEATRRAEDHLEMTNLMITDVLREGTELVFLGDKEIIRQAFNISGIDGNRVFLKGVVSRKKQMVPALAQLWG